MARLPQPGGDVGAWGNILNDFLSQAHNTDGSLKDIPQSKITNLTSDLASKADAADLSGKADASHTHTVANVTGLQAALDSKITKTPRVVRVEDFIPAGMDTASVDTASYWNQAIAAAGVGGVIRYDGRYRINSELQLQNFQTVEGVANFYGAGSGQVNFLDFQNMTANGNGEKVGFRLAASNIFRRVWLRGPGAQETAAYGVSSVTNPTPVATAPRFERVQFFNWTRGANLYGAYYTSFNECDWQYNAEACRFDSCYNMKLVNPRISARWTIDGGSTWNYGTGIKIIGAIRSLNLYSGSIENHANAVDCGSGANVHIDGTYFEQPVFAAPGSYVVNCADGASGVTITLNKITAYIMNHINVVRFTHMTGSNLVARGNKYLYSQISADNSVPAPLTPIIYAIFSPGTGTRVELKGDNTYDCYYSSPNQTWGYTDNIWTQGPIKGYDVDFPYRPSTEARADYALRGRVQVTPFRVVTADSTLLANDDRIIVNSASATTQKLPTVFGQIPGRTVRIKNIGAGTVTIGTAESSGVTITGTTSLTSGQSAEYILYGGNWYSW